jgi:hypothetical protein
MNARGPFCGAGLTARKVRQTLVIRPGPPRCPVPSEQMTIFFADFPDITALSNPHAMNSTRTTRFYSILRNPSAATPQTRSQSRVEIGSGSKHARPPAAPNLYARLATKTDGYAATKLPSFTIVLFEQLTAR